MKLTPMDKAEIAYRLSAIVNGDEQQMIDAVRRLVELFGISEWDVKNLPEEVRKDVNK